MVIGGERRACRRRASGKPGFNGAADGDRRRVENASPRRFARRGGFNGAADGDRRRVEWADADRTTYNELQRSRRW